MTKLLTLLCLIFAGALFFFEPQLNKKEEKPFYFAPPEIIKRFSFGFPDLYADILWMRLLQNIDFCSSKKGLPIYDGQRKYQCEKGWSYKMTSAVTELAPRFFAPYDIAGSIMSVIMGDKQGAKKIYDKALKMFPNHWQIHFSASYHYLIELKDEERAAELLIKTADLGGPLWLYALAAKSYQKKGQLLLSKEILSQAIKKDPTGKHKKAFEQRLKQVQKELDEL